MADFIAQCQKELEELERGIWHERARLRAKVETYVKDKWPEFELGKHSVYWEDGWAWDCEESPIGYCIYDDDEDPIHDFCLFCGQPMERK